ncbi:hypothetical protein DYB34_012623 [Aphanomyces astaci]|uniref:Peptidase A2 domain-containing protein n=1 Tax=Aphanomyces astaci TaxID=112090 RepID=A0A3R6W3Y1_APHAT|nr:hypothetical protein DYB34_012623 [Aphanomyces astaci]
MAKNNFASKRPRKRNLARNPGLRQGLRLAPHIRKAVGSVVAKATSGSKKPQVAGVATPDSRGEVKLKVVGAAVDMDEATAAPVLRTLECAINGLKATTLLDIGADQSVLSPTLLSRLETPGNFTSAVRQLDTAIELGGFLECMKLQVDRDVKLCLTFETAEEGLGDLIVSHDVMAKLGYCPRSLLLNARRAQSVYDLDRLGDKETEDKILPHKNC